MDFRKIVSCSGYTVAVAETLGVVTLTSIATASTVNAFVLRQYRPDLGIWVNNTFSHKTLATGSTATTVADAFRTAIAADDKFKVVLTGTTTCIITASAGYPLVAGYTLSSGELTVTQTTAGVPSKGTYNDLVRSGVLAADVESGATYSSIKYVYKTEANSDFLDNSILATHTVYVKSGITNLAAFAVRMNEVNQGYPAGGSTYPDNEAISLSGT